MEAIKRHDALMRVYTSSTRPDSRSSNTTTTTNSVLQHDLDVIRAHHQFLRDDDADAMRGNNDWQVRMSVRYYRRLFREYALADLSRYREGKVGLRWRTEREVVTGKGQFVCGNKRCDVRVGLRSYELLFAYREQQETKRCLVKVRACEACAGKLFYQKLREVRERQQKEKEAARHRGLSTESVSRSTKDKSGQKKKDKRTRHASGDRATDETEREGRHTKRQRRTRSTQDGKRSDAHDGDSSASEDDSEKDTHVQERSVHDLCAAINARECGHINQRTGKGSSSNSGDQDQQRLGFFEDRTGDRRSMNGQESTDDALFRDLLV